MKRMISTIMTGMFTLGAVATANGMSHMAEMTAEVLGSDGATVGTVTVREAPEGILLTIDLEEGALEPGWHGIHLHQVATCEDVGEFKKSGGHIDPAGTAHGLLNPDGPHPADLPNIYAASDGSVHAQMYNDRIGLNAGEVRILDDDGSALVIHESPDDHETQPIGGAGARVACAALK